MLNSNNISSKQWRKVSLFACIISLTLAGCSSEGNSGSTTSNGAEPLAGPLEGTWDLCGGLRNTYVFRGNTWEQYPAYFDNSDCVGPPLSEEGLQPADEPIATGTFELMGDVTTDSGVIARKLNLTATTIGSAIRYDIVFTGTTGEMVFGTFAGFTEDDRPVTLDFDASYIRR